MNLCRITSDIPCSRACSSISSGSVTPFRSKTASTRGHPKSAPKSPPLPLSSPPASPPPPPPPPLPPDRPSPLFPPSSPFPPRNDPPPAPPLPVSDIASGSSATGGGGARMAACARRVFARCPPSFRQLLPEFPAGLVPELPAMSRSRFETTTKLTAAGEAVTVSRLEKVA
ncbi:unnamed protein product [Closterium sp. NIES-54]